MAGRLRAQRLVTGRSGWVRRLASLQGGSHWFQDTSLSSFICSHLSSLLTYHLRFNEDNDTPIFIKSQEKPGFYKE